MSNPKALSLAAALVWAVPGILAVAPPLHAQTETPLNPIISAVRGDEITLAIGSNDGARIGDVYEIRSGALRARLRLERVDATESSAVLLDPDARNIVVVGEMARFTGREVAVPGAGDALALPSTALVQSLGRETATLAIGERDGARVGAVYALPQDGEIKVRLQITRVGETSSTARVTVLDNEFTATVGEFARFVEMAPTAIPVAPVEPVSPPVEPPLSPSVEPLPPVTPGSLPTSPSVSPSAPTASGEIPSTRLVTAQTDNAVVAKVSGETLTLTSGALGGAKIGQTVPVLRDGSVAALVRITEVEPTLSRGQIVWRDEAQPAVRVGDTLGMLTPTGILDEGSTTPVALVKFETGASNVSVPKNDRTYSLLASLAASGLITSQPARMFHDDGARRHRTAEDIIFSRAQIANFVREALSSESDRSGRDEAALAMLVDDYRRDLIDLGLAPELLAEVQNTLGQSNFRFGYSSFSRARYVGGDTDEDAIAPFAERFGAARLQTGIDSRINVFGTLGSKLKFFGQLDTGTDIREGEARGGTPAGGILPDNDSTTIRNAYVSYDASGLVRGLTVNVGRKEYWWGTGTFGTTTLGDAAGGLDSLNLIYDRGRLRYEGLYARLGEGPAGGDRSLYGQNLSYRFGQNAKLGLTTTILAPRDSLRPELLLGSVLPIPLYALDRLNKTGENTNAVVGAYGEVGIAQGLRLYGEIVLDDFSLNESNRIENRNGGLLGVQLFNARNPAKAGLTVEYARLNSISYVIQRDPPRKDADYDYYYRGAPLGYGIAPNFPTNFGGADTLRFDGYFKPQRKLTLFGSLEYSDLNSQDQNPAEDGENGFSRQRIYRIAATYDFSQRWSLTARAQQVKTDQPDFIKGGASVGTNSFSLEIGRSF